MRRQWVFAARVAAAGFCRRKTRASRWTPALLRWARRGERVRAGVSRHTHTSSHTHGRMHTQSSGGSWTTRLHLHFHLAALYRDWRSHKSVRIFPALRASQVSRTFDAGKSPRAASRRLSSAREPARTFTRTPGRTSAPAPAPASTPASAPTPARASVRRSWRTLPSTVVTRGSINRLTRQSKLPIARAAMRSTRFQEARPSIRPSARPPARPSVQFSTPPIQSSARPSTRPLRHAMKEAFAPAGRYEQVKHSWRTRREPASNLAPASNLTAWATRSAVDLVWRAPSDKVSASVARATSARETTHTAAVASSVHAPPSVPKTAERTIVCATALEPGLADRLAADVIRRIDRRARIERERKGM